MGKFLESRNIKLYHTYSKIKSSYIERFWRTLFTNIRRYMTERNTLKYYDVLQDFVKLYNSSYHSTIKMAPMDVHKDNEMQIWHSIYKKMFNDEVQVNKPEFNVGDLVRISVEKGIFEKGYEAYWSKEIFKIDRIRPGNPNVYYLKDLKGEDVTGAFYPQELDAADPVANENIK